MVVHFSSGNRSDDTQTEDHCHAADVLFGEDTQSGERAGKQQMLGFSAAPVLEEFEQGQSKEKCSRVTVSAAEMDSGQG